MLIEPFAPHVVAADPTGRSDALATFALRRKAEGVAVVGAIASPARALYDFVLSLGPVRGQTARE